MKKDIQQQIVKLFNTLNSEQKALVNQWCKDEMAAPNCVIFLGASTTTDDQGKTLCVMLNKAIEAKDFSAFGGPATTAENPKEESACEAKKSKPATTPAEPKKKDKEEESVASAPRPGTAQTPCAKANPAPAGSIDSLLIQLIDSRIKEKCSNDTTGGQPADSSGSITREEIRSIVRDEMNAYFKSILPK